MSRKPSPWGGVGQRTRGKGVEEGDPLVCRTDVHVPDGRLSSFSVAFLSFESLWFRWGLPSPPPRLQGRRRLWGQGLGLPILKVTRGGRQGSVRD